MRLRTRLTIATVTVSTASSLLLGGLSISQLRNAQVTSVDRALNLIVSQIDRTGDDALAQAMLAVDQSPIAVTLGFAAPHTRTTILREPAGEVLAVPDAPLLRDARDVLVTLDDTVDSRVRSVELTDGEWLYVQASLADIEGSARVNIALLGMFTLVLSLVIGLLVRRLVRRDTEGIEHLADAASRIAAGEHDVRFPHDLRSTEVADLADSLQQLVVSLRRSVEIEQAANARMQEFVGDASHELRTPLTVIRGYSEMLGRGDIDTAQRERALSRVQSEVARMEGLVNDLLLLVEVGTANREHHSSIDLSATVRTLVEDLRVLQPERDVIVDIDNGVRVEGVEEYVHRAIANAFANIRRHTPADAPVRVALHGHTLVIEDGGPGLSEAMYAAGIQHFQRFDKSRARDRGGSGLGMSIMAAIMRGLGGAIDVSRSELGGLRLDYRFVA